MNVSFSTNCMAMKTRKVINCEESQEGLVIKKNLVNVSRIKTLTRARKEEIQAVKTELKDQLPALTSIGVRRHRVDYHESVLLELKENGFKEAVDFLKMLYARDDQLENRDGKKLKKQRLLIDRIKIGLVNAELARRNHKIIEEAAALLETAIFFESLTSEWSWIADSFFKCALVVASRIDADDGEISNIIKYIYGKFLFDKNKPSGRTKMKVFKSHCLSTSLSLTLKLASLIWSIMLLIRVTFVSQAFILLVCQSTQVESLTPIDAAVLENDRPIIGILAQEIDYYLHQAYPGFNSYIMASYVKYVESAGARVVPIWIGEPESYYENILEKVNGVLFPGGPACFNETGGYADAGRVIYRIAKEMNDRHDFFPIWGTCLGFELLTFLEANGTEHRSHCDSSNQALPLKFKPEFKRSRMFGDAKEDIIEILENEDVTSNFHNYCVTEEDLAKVHLTEAFRVISTNNDTLGSEFISSLEHINYPFYGVQFHPEKNSFEWNPRLLLPHTANSILTSNYFANFFVNEVKELQGAIILLEEAREASRGKRWNASRFLKIQQGNLFKEVNSVLHEALITLADKLMEKNKNTAVKAAVRALECAKDTGNEVFIAKSLFEVGRAEMFSGNIAEAVQSFSRYLAIVKRIPDPNRMCNGHRELAFAYKAIKNIGGVQDHLNKFKELAEKSGLIERIAEAHYCLGEFILEQGDPSSATPHLNSAFDLYRSLSMMKEMDKARFLAGISKGKELKIEYLELMRKCEENDPEALRKLLEWKNRRTPFWN